MDAGIMPRIKIFFSSEVVWNLAYSKKKLDK